MHLIDVHCHLDHALFKDDVDDVVRRAREAGVVAILNNGTNHATNLNALALARKYPGLVRPCLGIYPVDGVGMTESDSGLPSKPVDVDAELAFIEQHEKDIAAIGEVGLDYHWVKDPELQRKEREHFAKIIALAERIKKPLIVHSRNAEADVVQMLESSKVKRVDLHCFAARKHIVKKAVDNGWCFSIPALVERLEHFRMLIDMAGTDQLLTETDAPWLPPIAGTRNEPANVRFGIRWIARQKGLTEDGAADAVFANYQRLFL
jgi:TatD DNase family protein